MKLSKRQFQKWGAEGSRIRNQRLSKARRKAIAMAAAKARWANHKETQ